MDSETYTSYTSTNLEFDTNYLRYVFSSMTQPSQVIQIDMNTLKKEVLKEQIIQGNFDVNKFAKDIFNGGGHKNAAGAISKLNMKQTINLFKKSLNKYKNQLN